MSEKLQSVLVTGANGQVGNELRVLSQKVSPSPFTFVDIEEMDLTSEVSIREYFRNKTFDVIINCAAYTAVDLAEQNSDLCYAINAKSVSILTEICKEKRIRLIHISTDYVFDGRGNEPLRENAVPNPLSVYGKSKLEGEKAVVANLPDAYVLRTAWVYSTFGKNFVKTISTLASQRESLTVIYDQIGSPTYARDLAVAILKIVEKIRSGENDVPGVYHFTNEGAISWFDFAYFIIDHYKLPCKLKPIRTEEYKTLAVRPAFSVLDKRKIKETLKIEIPHWHTSLIECLQALATSSQKQ